MRVLGIDPGTYHMGVGVVDSEDELTLVYSGVISPSKSDSLPRRLQHLFGELEHVLQECSPSTVAIEEPFVARNVRAAMAVGHAQAVAMLAGARHGLPISGYSPREVKRSVTDYGGSSKEQVQEMVRALLGLAEPPQPSDAADAAAVAICHINATRVGEIAIREWAGPT